MKEKELNIENIPAILWGERSDKVFIAIHGQSSYKRDILIRILADISQKYGYQVLSFDLPKHGERTFDDTFSKVQICIQELNKIYNYAKKNWKKIFLFSFGVGSFYSLLAYKDKNVENAFFLTPILNIEDFYEKNMLLFSITDEMLEDEKEIGIPLGDNLYWDEYLYIKENPVLNWKIPTTILCAEKDEICNIQIIREFSEKFNCNLEILKDSEHYFYTISQLNKLKIILENFMKNISK